MKPLFLLLLSLVLYSICVAQTPEPEMIQITPTPQRFFEMVKDEEGNLVEHCLIKGNIGNKNAKIYHCPSWRDYEKTIIDEDKGERWFCTEAEAIAAGWRAPKYATGPCR